MNEKQEQRRFVAEKDTRTVKPPQRSFTSFTIHRESSTRRPARSLILSGIRHPEQEGTYRTLLAAPLEEDYLRLSLTPRSAAPEDLPSLPASWAVPAPPPPLAHGSAEEIGTAPWSLDESGELHFGELTIGKWAEHSEALRFSLHTGTYGNIYGLGERMGRLERSGRVWDMWNTDEPDHLPTRDPLYVCIPFTLLRGKERWYGAFLDVPGRQYWDAGATAPGEVRFDVEDDYLDLYLFSGASPREVLSRYTRLTGRAPLPPRWALGFHQSRYSYYPDSEVREIARRFRREKLPADVIHLDIDYMNGYRVFSWNRERFPDPQRLARELGEHNFRLITIVDPGVKVDSQYRVYTEGRDNEHFCRRPDGTDYEGRVWPGTSVYPDFSSSRVRSWWAEQHRSLFDAGVAGIWNDMNEPADFTGDPDHRPDFTVPNDLQADNDGSPVSFRRFHNLYANAMNSATREAFARLRPDERGFVLSRSGYAGIQRSSAVWTGDNASWWEHLAAAVPMLLGLGLSGVPFVGSDTGGFQEDASPELYARWIAFSAFTPLFRAHTADDTGPHEPWSFGEKVLDIARHYLRLRYALLPYLYTGFEASSRTGDPLMAPLFFEWPEDRRLQHTNDTFLFGPSLLVAPVTAPDTVFRHLYLPPGSWYDFWDDRWSPGSEDILAPAPLERLPLFVRAGSIIPHEPPRLSTAEPHREPLTIEVYPDADGRAYGELYEDTGEGHGHKEGAFLRLAFHYAEGRLQVKALHHGFPSPWRRLKVRIHHPVQTPYEYRPAGDEALGRGKAQLPAPFNSGGAGIEEHEQTLDV